MKPKTKGKYTPNLDAFSNRKDVVYVITRFNAIEGRLAEILIKEIGAPEEKQAFLRDILFNSAILPFAAKVKLFLHLRVKKNWPKIDREVFRRLMEIRNQFAHSERSLEITVELLRERGKISSGRHVGNKMMLSSVTGSGELEKVDVADALAEFTQRWEVLSEYFTKLQR